MVESQEELVLILITSTALILILGTVIVFAVLIQNKRKFKYRQQLVQMKGYYEKTMLEAELKILEDTFKAISQNLHDNVGSNISTAMLLLYKDKNMDDKEHDLNRQEALGILDKIVDDLKNIAHSLNPDYLDQIGLGEAIKQRVEQLSRTKKYKIELQQDGSYRKLDRQKQLILFYIFQEAINNINTHAEARNINIRIKYEPNELDLFIGDDGKGMDVEKEMSSNVKGNGLINMRTHAAMIEAGLDIFSSKDTGTKIRVTVPNPYEKIH